MKLIILTHCSIPLLLRSFILLSLLASSGIAQEKGPRSVMDRFKVQASTQGEGEQNKTNQSFYVVPLSDSERSSAAKSQSAQDEAEVSFTILWLKLFLALGTFALLSFLLLRWLHRRRRALFPETDLFEIIAQFSLGINRSLQIVRVVREYYLLGVTNEQITSLAKLCDKETIDELQLQKKPTLQSGRFFQELVTSYFSGRNERERGSKKTSKNRNDQQGGSSRILKKQTAAQPLSSLLVTQFLKQRLKSVKHN